MNEVDSQSAASGSVSEPPASKQQSVQKMVFTIGSLETIAQRLEALPARQALTIHSAVQRLAPTIKKMRARGYSLDEAAAELRAGGLPLSARALARHLRTAAPKKRASASE